MDPGNDEVLLERAERLVDVGVKKGPRERIREARGVVQQVMDKSGATSTALGLKGKLDLLERRGEEAVRSLRQAVELRPDWAPLHFLLGWALYVEGNFLAGRSFDDFDDLNRQAIAFCDRVNAKTRRHLHGSARELFAAERDHLRPFPSFVPEVYALHHRIVDVEGYVNLDRRRYSVPYALIGRRLEIRETKDRIDAYQGPRLVASHRKVTGGPPVRVTLPEHRPRRGQRKAKVSSEEQLLLQMKQPLPEYATRLRKHSTGRGTLALRRLLALCREYTKEAVTKAVTTALEYGLFDLERLERLILRTIAKDYFVLPGAAERDDDNE